MSHFLYSTNPLLKYLIQQKYRSDKHHVWCSEAFDSQALSRRTVGAYVPPSSNPAEIYRALKRAVDKNDLHDPKIVALRAGIIERATRWHSAGEISSDDRDDIVYWAELPAMDRWKPLLYVIPRVVVAARLKKVPAASCAGLGNEFIIEDLDASEVDIIEP